MWPPWEGGYSGSMLPPTQGGHIGPPLQAPSRDAARFFDN